MAHEIELVGVIRMHVAAAAGGKRTTGAGQREFRCGVAERQCRIRGCERKSIGRRVGPDDVVGHARIAAAICRRHGRRGRECGIDHVLDRQDVAQLEILDRAAGLIAYDQTHRALATHRLRRVGAGHELLHGQARGRRHVAQDRRIGYPIRRQRPTSGGRHSNAAVRRIDLATPLHVGDGIGAGADAGGGDLADQEDVGLAIGRRIDIGPGFVVAGIAEGVVDREVRQRVTGGNGNTGRAAWGHTVVIGDSERGGGSGAGIIDVEIARAHDIVDAQILHIGKTAILHLDAPDDVVIDVAVDRVRVATLPGIDIAPLLGHIRYRLTYR